jgi:hypothetical protein
MTAFLPEQVLAMLRKYFREKVMSGIGSKLIYRENVGNFFFCNGHNYVEGKFEIFI